MIPLIPGADESASEHVFAIDRIKSTWRPTPAQLRARSFPTPFAQAEMMTHVLGLLELTPGAKPLRPELENARLEQSYERWRLLLLGVVLGLLEIENLDLRSSGARRFGAMLARLRPASPFLAVVRDRSQPALQGRPLVVAGADPECLLWCSPRLGSFIDHAGTYWNALKSRLDAHPDLPSALALLADWRESLRANGFWQLGSPHAPPWMKALEVLLHGVRDAGGASLARDARFVGPIPLTLPARTATGTETTLVYLPVHHPGWAMRFAELLFFQPVARESEAGVVDLMDPVGRAVAQVRVAPSEAQAGFELLAGVGRIDERPGVPRIHGAVYWLDDAPAGRGYRSQIFEPLLAAAARSHRRPRIDERQILANPILFPDALRLLAQRPAFDDARGVRITLSRAVTARLRTGETAPHTGTPVASWEPGTEWPRVLALPAPPGAVSAGLIESFGADDARVDVGEVRALGFTLWTYFVGDAELRADGASVLWSAHEDQELLGRVRVQGIDRPLEVSREALAAVHDERMRAKVRDQLATLQRFARTWRAFGDGDAALPHELGARVGRIAAEAFVAWVLDPGDRLGGFGAQAAKSRDAFVLYDDAAVPLVRDAYVAWR